MFTLNKNKLLLIVMIILSFFSSLLSQAKPASLENERPSVQFKKSLKSVAEKRRKLQKKKRRKLQKKKRRKQERRGAGFSEELVLGVLGGGLLGILSYNFFKSSKSSFEDIDPVSPFMETLTEHFTHKTSFYNTPRELVDAAKSWGLNNFGRQECAGEYLTHLFMKHPSLAKLFENPVVSTLIKKKPDGFSCADDSLKTR